MKCEFCGVEELVNRLSLHLDVDSVRGRNEVEICLNCEHAALDFLALFAQHQERWAYAQQMGWTKGGTKG